MIPALPWEMRCTHLLCDVALVARNGGAVDLADEPEDGEAEEDQGRAQQRSFEVSGVAVDEDCGGAEDEDAG